MKTLNELIDFPNPGADRDVLKKFVSRVVAKSKTHFRWYMNLDGSSEFEIEADVEGRKNNAVVSIDGEGPKSLCQTGKQGDFSYSDTDVRHRLLSQLAGLFTLPICYRFPLCQCI